MNLQELLPGLACIFVALLIMFRLTHYAHFYAPSYFFWIGIIIFLVGTISLIQPLTFLFVFSRIYAAIVLSVGILISILSLVWPVKVNYSTDNLKIDDLLPDYSFGEYHEVSLDASVDKAKHTLQTTGVSAIPVIHLLMKIRGIADEKDMSDIVANNQANSETFSTPDFNFFMVDPAEYISVMIMKASVIAGGSKKLPAPPEISKLEQFTAFNNPGYVKVAINFRFISLDKQKTLLSTETRVQGTTSGDSRLFGLYWRIIYPGSAIIRRVWLDTIKKIAENR